MCNANNIVSNETSVTVSSVSHSKLGIMEKSTCMISGAASVTTCANSVSAETSVTYTQSFPRTSLASNYLRDPTTKQYQPPTDTYSIGRPVSETISEEDTVTVSRHRITSSINPAIHASSTLTRPHRMPNVPVVCYQPLSTLTQTRDSNTHMTVGNVKAANRPEGTCIDKMDSRFSSGIDIFPHINTCGDTPFSTEFLEPIYASSPNSLYMYEQEKMDMQSTLGGTTSCTSSSVGASDDFELKAQYEMSHDIMPISSPVTSHVQEVCCPITSDTSGGIWSSEICKQMHPKRLIEHNTTDQRTGPTLTELNLDLLDDIETFINVDMNQISPCSMTVDKKPDIKEEPTFTKVENYQFVTPATTVQNINNQTAATQNISGSHQHLPLVTVKTEPVDLDLDHDKYRMLYSSSAPQSTMSFLPMPGLTQSASVPDASKSVLQELLQKRRPHALPTTLTLSSPRKPTSETAMLKSPTLKSPTIKSPTLKSPGRKRSGQFAGLESMETKWQEIKHFIHTDGGLIIPIATPTETASSYPPVVKHERQRYDSTSSVKTYTSSEDYDSYQGDDSDSDREIDYEEMSDSDLEGGADLSALDPSESLIGRSKEKQYFWQYNVQSKGPKGKRVKFDMEEDPHVVHDFEDPVFDPTNSSVEGIGVTIKHGGKARKGDGNDIVPCPKKLCQLGLRLRKIAKQINDFTPVSELPSQARSKSRKEKNKLASRACRLKKKAQHEANKVKLHGLELEHQQLLKVIKVVQEKLVVRVKVCDTGQEPGQDTGQRQPMTRMLEQLIKENLSVMIAGHTTEYVNKVVRRVEEGDTTGGIELKASRSYPKELHN